MTAHQAFAELYAQLDTWGVVDTDVSCNLIMRANGYPRGRQQEPKDPGVALFYVRNGREEVIAIDTYDRVADNVYAIARCIERLRGLERDGASQVFERMATTLQALPPTSCSPWRSFFGFEEMEQVSLDSLRAKYKRAASEAHPDQGGTDAKFRMVVEMYEQAAQELASR